MDTLLTQSHAENRDAQKSRRRRRQMAQNTHYFCWEWQLQSAPEAVWPFFADTNRLNRDAGIFPVEELSQAETAPGQHRLRYRLPLPVEWDEAPFEWTFPYRYGVLRQYRRGPLRTMRILATLNRTPEDGTHLVYETWVEPANILGRLALPLALGIVAPRRFATAVTHYDTLAQKEMLPEAVTVPASLSPGGRQRLQTLTQQLRDQGLSDYLVDCLTDLLQTADDLTLARIRPYVFADLWQASRREVLELFLWATRLGLLNFQWELLCPMCRGAEDRVHAHLQDVETEAHCSTCNIDFSADFEQSVELSFTPNPAIRTVARREFCVAGPQQTPHIAVQQLLPPRQQRLVMPLLENGRYRLRTQNLPGGLHFQVRADGHEAALIQATPAGWVAEEVPLAPEPTLSLANQTESEQLFVLERMAWSDQATTAAEVVSLQRFRDLFSDEALRPGEQFSVGSLTVLFTDLRDSTRLYREIGDATAFGLVLNHFDVLQDMIDAEGGAIVKTIGDAVMAVFKRPVAALRAMTRAQETLANPPQGKRPLFLKAAIHAGPSIAVTLNERLDYFGTTINMAARLEKFSGGKDIVISDRVYTDPEVRTFLEAADNPFAAAPFEAQLRGFDEECFALWRVSVKQL